MASKSRVRVQDILDTIHCDTSDVSDYDSDSDEEYVVPATPQVFIHIYFGV